MGGQAFGRLQNMVAQGVLALFGSKKLQAKVLDGEVLENLTRVEPYGFSYRPKAGAEVYLVFPSGDRSHGIALVVGDKRYQLELEEGEAALHDDRGNWVKMKTGDIIECKAAAKVLADTPLFETTHDAKIGGNLEVAGNTVTSGSTASGGGYSGLGNARAELTKGVKVLGVSDFDAQANFNAAVKHMNKSIGADHTHMENGTQTGGVV